MDRFSVRMPTGPFTVTVGGGPFVLDHAKTWPVTIQFTPVVKGAANGALPISSDDPKHPLGMSVSP
jgi:hypothetical protein